MGVEFKAFSAPAEVVVAFLLQSLSVVNDTHWCPLLKYPCIHWTSPQDFVSVLQWFS